MSQTCSLLYSTNDAFNLHYCLNLWYATSPPVLLFFCLISSVLMTYFKIFLIYMKNGYDLWQTWWTLSFFPPQLFCTSTIGIQLCKTESTFQLQSWIATKYTPNLLTTWLVKRWEENLDPNHAVHGIFLTTVTEYVT